MKLKTLSLVLLLFFFGCSSNFDLIYGQGHIPPGKTSAKNKPATQKPYKIKGKKYYPIPSATGFVQKGRASWYGKKFHGRQTSNGEIYNMYAMTAAHKTLPMNTWVAVHNLENNKKIVVRINDRGPFVRGRIIDLSYTGAKRIGIAGPGTARVKVTALGEATAFTYGTKDPVSFKAVNYWKGDFTVQVGAFELRSNAEKYRYDLSKRYDNAHITTYTDHRGRFFRVRVGKFTNLQEAVRFSETLMEQGFENAFAVAR